MECLPRPHRYRPRSHPPERAATCKCTCKQRDEREPYCVCGGDARTFASESAVRPGRRALTITLRFCFFNNSLRFDLPFAERGEREREGIHPAIQLRSNYSRNQLHRRFRFFLPSFLPSDPLHVSSRPTKSGSKYASPPPPSTPIRRFHKSSRSLPRNRIRAHRMRK